MKHRRTLVALLLLLAVALPFPALAQGVLDDVQIHGFGGWAYEYSDVEALGVSESEGEYDKRGFALNISATPSERLTVNAQVYWGTPPDDLSGNEDIEVNLDFAFAEWAFSDQLRLRGGVVKQPFGLYNEVFEVGTVRPFFDLPETLYAASGFIGKGYQGLGITGRSLLGDGGWELQYDLYGGEIDLPSIGQERKLKDLVGGRLILHTPVSGLNVGVSAYTGEPDIDGEDEEVDPEDFEQQDAVGGHVEYLDDLWTVRAELVERNGGDAVDTSLQSGYLEVARRLGSHWQVGARYQQAESRTDGGPDLPFDIGGDADVLEATLNYWFNAFLVAKLSYGETEFETELLFDGSFPLPPGTPTTFTTSVDTAQLGIQFSF